MRMMVIALAGGLLACIAVIFWQAQEMAGLREEIETLALQQREEKGAKDRDSLETEEKKNWKKLILDVKKTVRKRKDQGDVNNPGNKGGTP
jgi:hypothetical protein